MDGNGIQGTVGQAAQKAQQEKIGAVTRHPHLHPCDSPANDCYVGREPLMWRLQREASNLGDEAARKRRAIELLTLHPEFEELLELLRLVPNF